MWLNKSTPLRNHGNNFSQSEFVLLEVGSSISSLEGQVTMTCTDGSWGDSEKADEVRIKRSSSPEIQSGKEQRCQDAFWLLEVSLGEISATPINQLLIGNSDYSRKKYAYTRHHINDGPATSAPSSKPCTFTLIVRKIRISRRFQKCQKIQRLK